MSQNLDVSKSCDSFPWIEKQLAPACCQNGVRVREAHREVGLDRLAARSSYYRRRREHTLAHGRIMKPTSSSAARRSSAPGTSWTCWSRPESSSRPSSRPSHHHQMWPVVATAEKESGPAHEYCSEYCRGCCCGHRFSAGHLDWEPFAQVRPPASTVFSLLCSTTAFMRGMSY